MSSIPRTAEGQPDYNLDWSNTGVDSALDLGTDDYYDVVDCGGGRSRGGGGCDSVMSRLSMGDDEDGVQTPFLQSQSRSFGGSTLTELSSVFSMSEDEFDRLASRQTMKLLEEVDSALYMELDEFGDSQPLTAECEDWASNFPHLRLLGTQLCPSREDWYQLHPVNDRGSEGKVGGGGGGRESDDGVDGINKTVFINASARRSSSRTSPLFVTGRGLVGSSSTLVPCRISYSGRTPRSRPGSSRSASGGARGLIHGGAFNDEEDYEEEVLEENGTFEEILAIDSHPDCDDTGRRTASYRLQRGLPPLTPQSSLRDSILSALSDQLYKETFSIVQPLWQRFIQSLNAKMSDLNADQLEDDLRDSWAKRDVSRLPTEFLLPPSLPLLVPPPSSSSFFQNRLETIEDLESTIASERREKTSLFSSGSSSGVVVGGAHSGGASREPLRDISDVLTVVSKAIVTRERTGIQNDGLSDSPQSMFGSTRPSSSASHCPPTSQNVQLDRLRAIQFNRSKASPSIEHSLHTDIRIKNLNLDQGLRGHRLVVSDLGDYLRPGSTQKTTTASRLLPPISRQSTATSAANTFAANTNINRTLQNCISSSDKSFASSLAALSRKGNNYAVHKNNYSRPGNNKTAISQSPCQFSIDKPKTASKILNNSRQSANCATQLSSILRSVTSIKPEPTKKSIQCKSSKGLNERLLCEIYRCQAFINRPDILIQQLRCVLTRLLDRHQNANMRQCYAANKQSQCTAKMQQRYVTNTHQNYAENAHQQYTTKKQQQRSAKTQQQCAANTQQAYAANTQHLSQVTMHRVATDVSKVTGDVNLALTEKLKSSICKTGCRGTSLQSNGQIKKPPRSEFNVGKGYVQCVVGQESGRKKSGTSILVDSGKVPPPKHSKQTTTLEDKMQTNNFVSQRRPLSKFVSNSFAFQKSDTTSNIHSAESSQTVSNAVHGSKNYSRPAVSISNVTNDCRAGLHCLKSRASSCRTLSSDIMTYATKRHHSTKMDASSSQTVLNKTTEMDASRLSKATTIKCNHSSVRTATKCDLSLKTKSLAIVHVPSEIMMPVNPSRAYQRLNSITAGLEKMKSCSSVALRAVDTNRSTTLRCYNRTIATHTLYNVPNTHSFSDLYDESHQMQLDGMCEDVAAVGKSKMTEVLNGDSGCIVTHNVVDAKTPQHSRAPRLDAKDLDFAQEALPCSSDLNIPHSTERLHVITHEGRPFPVHRGLEISRIPIPCGRRNVAHSIIPHKRAGGDNGAKMSELHERAKCGNEANIAHSVCQSFNFPCDNLSRFEKAGDGITTDTVPPQSANFPIPCDLNRNRFGWTYKRPSIRSNSALHHRDKDTVKFPLRDREKSSLSVAIDNRPNTTHSYRNDIGLSSLAFSRRTTFTVQPQSYAARHAATVNNRRLSITPSPGNDLNVAGSGIMPHYRDTDAISGDPRDSELELVSNGNQYDEIIRRPVRYDPPMYASRHVVNGVISNLDGGSILPLRRLRQQQPVNTPVR